MQAEAPAGASCRSVYITVSQASGCQDPRPAICRRSRWWCSGLLASLLLVVGVAAAAFAAHRKRPGRLRDGDAIIVESQRWPSAEDLIIGKKKSLVGNPGPGHRHAVYRVRPQSHCSGAPDSQDVLLSVSAPRWNIRFRGGTQNERKFAVRLGRHATLDFKLFRLDGTSFRAEDFRVNVLDLDASKHTVEYVKAFPDEFHTGSAIHAVGTPGRFWPQVHMKWTFSAKQGGVKLHGASAVHLRYLHRNEFHITIGTRARWALRKKRWRIIKISIGHAGTPCMPGPVTQGGKTGDNTQLVGQAARVIPKFAVPLTQGWAPVKLRATLPGWSHESSALWPEGLCLALQPGTDAVLGVEPCKAHEWRMMWMYNPTTLQLKNLMGFCIGLDASGDTEPTKCLAAPDFSQKWKWSSLRGEFSLGSSNVHGCLGVDEIRIGGKVISQKADCTGTPEQHWDFAQTAVIVWTSTGFAPPIADSPPAWANVKLIETERRAQWPKGLCLSVDNGKVGVKPCTNETKMMWMGNPRTGQLRNGNGQCAYLLDNHAELGMTQCDIHIPPSKAQTWNLAGWGEFRGVGLMGSDMECLGVDKLLDGGKAITKSCQGTVGEMWDFPRKAVGDWTKPLSVGWAPVKLRATLPGASHQSSAWPEGLCLALQPGMDAVLGVETCSAHEWKMMWMYNPTTMQLKNLMDYCIRLTASGDTEPTECLAAPDFSQKWKWSSARGEFSLGWNGECLGVDEIKIGGKVISQRAYCTGDAKERWYFPQTDVIVWNSDLGPFRRLQTTPPPLGAMSS